MLSPAAFSSPAGSSLGRAVITAARTRQQRQPTRGCLCLHTRTLSTTGRARLLHSGRGQLLSRPSMQYGTAPSFSPPSARRCAFHRTVPSGMPRRRSFFTSNLLMRPEGNNSGKEPPGSDAQSPPVPSPTAAAMQAAKRKPRSAGAKHSLRRVAVIAQQQPGATASSPPASPASSPTPTSTPAATKEKDEARAADRARKSTDGMPSHAKHAARPSKLHRDLHEAEPAAATATVAQDAEDGSNVISAVCLAESFDMERVMSILEAQGFHLDPDGSGFESHEVVHARKQWLDDAELTNLTKGNEIEAETNASLRQVDLFVFESGTLVAWGLPADAVDTLATSQLVAAAADPFVDLRETETLDFRRDALRDTSAMRGDVVVLGTRHEATEGDRLATTRAQIAFSSGLARSTKLAVLERTFTDYFESTRRIPEMLAGRGKGGKGLGHISQKFILQKTGELLSLRAQLNHYRELTDALPDIFWDARAELGLEGYYEQVGRALDVGVRIKTLNQKMDYAQEIATVLREVSSERHGTRLEWIIIVLIAVEVVFELRRVYLDWHEDKKEERRLTKESRE